MRTTVRLDAALLARAKKHAAETGRSLTALIEDALRESLSRRQPGAVEQHIRLVSFGRGGTRPGVDLHDSAALRDHMDDLG